MDSKLYTTKSKINCKANGRKERKGKEKGGKKKKWEEWI